MRVVIVDYGAGNLLSVSKAFEHAAHDGGHSCSIRVSRDPEEVAGADHIVLPGVGAFRDCKRGIAAIPGMMETLFEHVLLNGRPFMGICVGMQLMASHGFEHGVEDGFGWIDGGIEPIVPSSAGLKVPHMGWNILEPVRSHPLFADISLGCNGFHAYFLHSYMFKPSCDDDIVAYTDHGGPVVAMIARDNMIGLQFHPEKSQRLGLRMIGNFLRWKP